jgi:aerobic carbon-monoxide dehydrogenase large subunit
VSAAAKAPGVVAVFTGEDVKQDGIGGLICGWMIHSKDGSPMNAGPHPVLADGKVRYVGDHVAMVVAESLDQAKAAAELVEVDLRQLPAAVTDRQGAKPRRPAGPRRGPQQHRLRVGDGRQSAPSMRPSPVPSTSPAGHRQQPPDAQRHRAARRARRLRSRPGALTLYTTSQNPHVARLVLSAFIGIAPEHKLRVIAPDVGGGFGSKIFIYAEEVCCLWASKKIGGRPVKWTCRPVRSFMSDAHGRDHVTTAELAMDRDGKFRALQGPHDRQHGRLSLDLRLLRPDLPLRHASVGPVRHAG